jgi:hypothetical protein
MPGDDHYAALHDAIEHFPELVLSLGGGDFDRRLANVIADRSDCALPYTNALSNQWDLLDLTIRAILAILYKIVNLNEYQIAREGRLGSSPFRALSAPLTGRLAGFSRPICTSTLA